MSKMKEVMMHPWGYGIDVRVYFNNVKDINLLLPQFNKFGYSWYMPDKTNMKLYKNS